MLTIRPVNGYKAVNVAMKSKEADLICLDYYKDE